MKKMIARSAATLSAHIIGSDFFRLYLCLSCSSAVELLSNRSRFAPSIPNVSPPVGVNDFIGNFANPWFAVANKSHRPFRTGSQFFKSPF